MKKKNFKLLDYKIICVAGKSLDFKKITGLTKTEIQNLNTIGYSGKLNGKKTSFEKYLNTLNKGLFRVIQTKFDNGNFREEYIVVRVI